MFSAKKLLVSLGLVLVTSLSACEREDEVIITPIEGSNPSQPPEPVNLPR